MKKLEKIHIIDAPRDNMLSDDDLLNFLGGDNCSSYTQCSSEGKSHCSTFDSGACSGTTGANLKCGEYSK